MFHFVLVKALHLWTECLGLPQNSHLPNMIVLGDQAFGRRLITWAECSSVGSVSLGESSDSRLVPLPCEHSERQSA